MVSVSELLTVIDKIVDQKQFQQVITLAQEHVRSARKVAVQSIVLLKSEQEVLPVSGAGSALRDVCKAVSKTATCSIKKAGFRSLDFKK